MVERIAPKMKKLHFWEIRTDPIFENIRLLFPKSGDQAGKTIAETR